MLRRQLLPTRMVSLLWRQRLSTRLIRLPRRQMRLPRRHMRLLCLWRLMRRMMMEILMLIQVLWMQRRLR